MQKTAILQLFSLSLLMILWAGISVLGAGDLLPAPWIVAGRIGEEFQSGELFYHCGITLLRVVAAFGLAMIFGCVIGISMGLQKTADRFFDPWLLLFLNIPALVVIVLCYLWIGLGEVAAILAVAINKIPNVAVTLREGTRNLDAGLAEMAKIYKLPLDKRIRTIILPQLTPYIMASARSGLALVWKIVLVVELLGRSNGVGFQLHLFFQLFDVAGILAYSMVFILIIAVIEHLIMKPLDQRLHAWRAK
ncbi:ABC transporter permease [Terasakiella sp. A23]|uniref:ABC transporter permease n=1 Tax=Terasakiella sp. FCG-A23 TaxID=3080561 RepID=UPI0029535FEE|nr:ABC transporter permease [Terasakiella sp. A23]MDV7339331.1 ABC transporter permease [Terasakiella sp. A23]